jgi:hypothetical protein
MVETDIESKTAGAVGETGPSSELSTTAIGAAAFDEGLWSIFAITGSEIEELLSVGKSSGTS